MSPLLRETLAGILGTTAAGLVSTVGFWLGFRAAVRRTERGLGRSPRTSLLELFFSLEATSPRDVILTLQRAQQGKPAEHPMGSPPRGVQLDEFGWDPATLFPPAKGRSTSVTTRTVLGPRAARPLPLEFPVVIAPMGYGIAVNRETKVALAQASALVGIATDSGEGPFLPEERAYAARWILEFGRGPWNHQPETLRLADMLEIQVGQASEAATGVRKPPRQLPRAVRRATDAPGRTFQIHGGLKVPLGRLIRRLRAVNPDVPLAVKIPANNHLEEDLERLLAWGVDVIVLDGAAAGSSSSPAVVSDHFGVSAVEAVVRAHHWLITHGRRGEVSLVASGGIRDGGDVAKILALGADAVAVGSAVLMAATHGQGARVLPRYSPSRLVFAGPRRSRRERLDTDVAALHAVNWLRATRAELRLVAQAVGVSHIAALSPYHLIARTPAAEALLATARADAPTGWRLSAGLRRLVSGYRDVSATLARTAGRLEVGLTPDFAGEDTHGRRRETIQGR
jgi:hypothetical protein